MYDHSGTKYVFGNSVTTRVGPDTAVFTPTVQADNDCHFTSAWVLTHIEDPNGNSVDITYQPINGAAQPINNVLYPTSVDYGGNSHTGLQHFYHVTFNYGTRPDKIENDLSGVSAVLTKRLTSIVVTTDVPTAGTAIRTYTLTYDTTPNGQNGLQSILSSVGVTGHPTQSFVYQDGVAGLGSQSYTPPTGMTSLRTSTTQGSVSQMLMDMNGDGFVDMVQAGTDSWSVYYGSASGFSTSSTPWDFWVASPNFATMRHAITSGQWSTTDRDTFDINGDGIPDFVDASQSSSYWVVYLGDPPQTDFTGAFDAPVHWQVPAVPPGASYWGIRTTQTTNVSQFPDDPSNAARIVSTFTHVDVIDMNGDGLPDLVVANSNTWQVYFNDGVHGFAADPVSIPAPAPQIRLQVELTLSGYGYDGGVQQDLIDFNGDGLPDVVAITADPVSGANPTCPGVISKPPISSRASRCTSTTATGLRAQRRNYMSPADAHTFVIGPGTTTIGRQQTTTYLTSTEMDCRTLSASAATAMGLLLLTSMGSRPRDGTPCSTRVASLSH